MQHPENFKLLFLDIETSPALVRVWSLFNQNIGLDQIVEPTSILCWAAKWRGEKDVSFAKAQPRNALAFRKMIVRMHELLSFADAVCTYNGSSFDIPRLNTQFAQLGLKPPPPVPNIDLRTVVKKTFDFTSGKLGFVGPALNIGKKVEHEGWGLWNKCLANDADAWKRMEKYNRQDVVLLEQLYDKILPWIDGHPNLNLHVAEEGSVCPNCGGASLSWQGVRRTTTQVYKRFQCQACGKWGRARLRDKTEPVAKVR